MEALDNGHDWAEWKFTRRTMTCCNKCGVVKRSDGKNKPCKGNVRVSLRSVNGGQDQSNEDET